MVEATIIHTLGDHINQYITDAVDIYFIKHNTYITLSFLIKHFQERFWRIKLVLTPQIFIKVSVPSQESEFFFLLRTVPTVWYFLFFILFD